MMKRTVAFLMAVVLVVGMMPVTASAATKKATVKSVSIKNLDTTTLVLKPKKTFKLKTKVTVTGKASKKVTYSSSKKSVATVSKSGKIKALKKGTTKITVKSVANSKKKVTIKVIVGTPATKITLDKNTAEAYEGEQITLTATVSPKKPSVKTVKFSSDNEEIAKVDEKGVVTCNKEGTVVITAETTDGSKKKAVCKVTVKKKAAEQPATTTEDKKTEDKTTEDKTTEDEKPTVIPVKGVTLDKETIELHIGRDNEKLTDKLTAIVSPENATNKAVLWESADANVAKIADDGTITALKPGKTEIKVITDDGEKTAICKVVVTKEATLSTADENGAVDAPKQGYSLTWHDEFDGDSLNRDDWNVELHEKGWVNAELQEYVDNEGENGNFYVKDDKLVIRPIKTGEDSYTSGRISTQNNKDFKYGMFEVKAKVPEGKGFLPAFWLMATDETIYGQWPRCGEIDIMEVHGSATDTSYGTIHYGLPQKQNQETYQLTEGSFSDDFHTFTCEWEPGKITWYIDGVEYYSTNDWYSAMNDKKEGELAYPAPFDQNFYIILNLAVGGSWVGNPDENTDIENATYEVDYVRVWQKDAETYAQQEKDVVPPTKEVTLREPDANGNYVLNGNFAENESLSKGSDKWEFLTAEGGVGKAKIANNAITITPEQAGTQNYSLQLVQTGIPAEQNDEYQLSFDAYATQARDIVVGVSAPERSWKRYLTDTKISLTTEKKTYTLPYTMTDETDAAARLEFNFGNTDSVAGVVISNVKITKTQDNAAPEKDNTKTILGDGNHVYNGSFQEGVNPKYLGYWDISKSANVSVTPWPERKLKVVNGADGDVTTISQDGLALTAGSGYVLSFDPSGLAESDVLTGSQKITITVSGQSFEWPNADDRKSFKFTAAADKKLEIKFSNKGTFYIDDIRIVEDKMIKNGSFNAGQAGYEFYCDSNKASASWAVDSITEKNTAAVIDVNNTGNENFYIQLKQNNVPLENGTWYKLGFKARTTLADGRKIRVIMQGGVDKGWEAYSGENIVELTSDYQSFEKTFQMTSATDPKAFLSIYLAAVDGVEINTPHKVCIDDIYLEETEAVVPETEWNDSNILKNADFSDSESSLKNWVPIVKEGDTVPTAEKGVVTYTIANVGAEKHDVELKQESVALKAGYSYKISFDIESSVDRTVYAKLQQNGGSWTEYGGMSFDLKANTKKTCETIVEMTKADEAALFAIDMGKFAAAELGTHTVKISNIKLVESKEATSEVTTTPSVVTLSDVSLKMISDEEGHVVTGEELVKDITTKTNWALNEATIEVVDNNVVATVADIGSKPWDAQIIQSGISLQAGCTYKLQFKASADVARKIEVVLQQAEKPYTVYNIIEGKNPTFNLGTTMGEVPFEVEFTMNATGDENAKLAFNLGKIQ